MEEVEELDSNGSRNTKARASLPEGFEIRESGMIPGRDGVFALMPVFLNTRFGPYEGQQVEMAAINDGKDITHMWEVSNDVGF